MTPPLAFSHAPYSPYPDDRGLVLPHEHPKQWLWVTEDGLILSTPTSVDPGLFHRTAPPYPHQKHFWLSKRASLAFTQVDWQQITDRDGLQASSVRDLQQMVSEKELSLCAQASALVQWMARYRFCPHCGSSLQPGQDFSLVCTFSDCNKAFFPSPAPAVIVAVTNENDELLLARQPHWPTHRLSVIAGFVMPGETLEQAVFREVEEETGVKLGEVRYVASQPWPFPNTLMLAFWGLAVDSAIAPKDNELVDIQWISRSALEAGLANGTLKAGGEGSVSSYLIRRWLEGSF